MEIVSKTIVHDSVNETNSEWALPDIDIVNEEWAGGIAGFRDPDEQTLHGCRLWEGVSGHDPALPSLIIDHAWIE